MEFPNGGNGGRGGKGSFEVLHARCAEAAAGRSKRNRIAIDAEDGRTHVADDCRVAAAAQRRIDGTPATCRPRPDGFRKDRDVVGDRGSRGHAP
jgi:hypothetical protein